MNDRIVHYCTRFNFLSLVCFPLNNSTKQIVCSVLIYRSVLIVYFALFNSTSLEEGVEMGLILILHYLIRTEFNSIRFNSGNAKRDHDTSRPLDNATIGNEVHESLANFDLIFILDDQTRVTRLYKWITWQMYTRLSWFKPLKLNVCYISIKLSVMNESYRHLMWWGILTHLIC